MAFKEISDSDTTISLGGTNKKTGKPNPVSITGYYLGTREVKTEYGLAQLHNLQTETGTVGVWGKTDLNKKMTAVPAGAMIRITQNGMMKMAGRNSMYKYKVEVDTDDTLSFSSSEQSGEEENNELFPQLNEDYEESAVDEEEEHLDEVPPARPVAAKKATSIDADRQAKVKSLLSKGRAASQN